MSAGQQAVMREVEDSAPDDHPVEELSKDTVFEILKNQRRRYVLAYLEETTGPVRLGELAEKVAAWENDTEVSKLTSKQRKRVYVGLYQGHLPKMDDAGVVEFNQDRGLVELTDRAAELRRYLDRENETSSRWSTYYLALSGVNGSLLAGAAVGLPLLGSIPGIILASIGVTTLLGLALWHTYNEHEFGELTARLPVATPGDGVESTDRA